VAGVNDSEDRRSIDRGRRRRSRGEAEAGAVWAHLDVLSASLLALPVHWTPRRTAFSSSAAVSALCEDTAGGHGVVVVRSACSLQHLVHALRQQLGEILPEDFDMVVLSSTDRGSRGRSASPRSGVRVQQVLYYFSFQHDITLNATELSTCLLHGQYGGTCQNHRPG
jgi:hypothetical protein